MSGICYTGEASATKVDEIMKIDMLAVSGSPLGQTTETIWGKDGHIGVGGSELFMLTLCEEWQKLGHQVRLFNNPRKMGASPFPQYPINAFQEGEDRDVLIGFRVLNEHFARAKAGIKVWLSCDQYASGDFKQFHLWADKTVCISDFHTKYFADHYDIFDAVSIPIPVRMSDYVGIVDKKVHQRCLFSSVPDRGLDVLAIAWPRIVSQVPDASLVITSDYRLWNQPHPNNERHRQAFMRVPNVQFLGAVPRLRLLKEQSEAEIMPYSSTYPELFCIAVSEAEYAGCWPITSDIGALATTNLGTVIKGDAKNYAWIDQFVAETVKELTKSNLDKVYRSSTIHQLAGSKFNPTTILGQWNNEVFNGK